MRKWALMLFWLAVSGSPALAEEQEQAQNAPRVVVTVKPLHSLVSAVMQGDVDEPVLLVGGKASPHTFQLAPSQMQLAAHADMVFANGAGLEPFLPRLEQALPENTRLVVMARQIGMFLLPLRRAADFDGKHGQGAGEEETRVPHDASVADPHLWLDPVNAINMVDVIVENLSDLYPSRASLYRQNGEALKEQLKSLDDDIRERMMQLKGSRFIEFHDALQYFEHAYGLQAAGTITLAETPPGAQHLSEIRRQVESGEVVCVLQEPYGNGKLVEQLTEGTPARVSSMDPEAVAFDPGPKLYLNLLAFTADEIEKCLR